MPPGQPILRCQGCGLLRPCKEFDGEWVCVECSPIETDGRTVAADGGDRDE